MEATFTMTAKTTRRGTLHATRDGLDMVVKGRFRGVIISRARPNRHHPTMIPAAINVAGDFPNPTRPWPIDSESILATMLRNGILMLPELAKRLPPQDTLSY
jgi:hypothetical protein